MMPWALVFAADMAAGLTLEPKKRRRKDMVGDVRFPKKADWIADRKAVELALKV